MSGSAFIVQPYRRKFLDAWSERMSTDNLGCLWDDNVASVLEEQGIFARESPRSIYRVSKLYEALNKYSPANRHDVDLNNKYIRAGIRFAYACFSCRREHKLEALAFTPAMVYDITSNHQGSAGLTAWGQTKAESVTRAYERGLQILKNQKFPEPCVAFKRTQFEDKTRLVWGYPYSMTAIEGIFARPLIECFKQKVTPMAFAMSTCELGVRMRVSNYHNDWIYSIDMSSFDSSASQQLIKVAFDILATWFNLDRIEPTSGVSYRSIWQRVRNYFIFTPIVMPDKNVYKGKKHGVPSGSYFTQMIDSIINIIYVGAISEKFNFFVGRDDVNVLGDDVVFWTKRLTRLENIADFASKLFQGEFNVKKTARYRYDEDFKYLGRMWKNGIPYQDLEEIKIRMTQPETFRKYSREETKRVKEVMNLIASFSAQFSNAYELFVKSLGKINWWETSPDLLEYQFLHLGYEIDPNFLSGYERYRRKYLMTENDNVPLALQFWK